MAKRSVSPCQCPPVRVSAHMDAIAGVTGGSGHPELRECMNAAVWRIGGGCGRATSVSPVQIAAIGDAAEAVLAGLGDEPGD